MPRTASPARRQIAQLLAEFADRIQKLVESHARPAWPDDVRERVLAALGVGAKRGPGRPKGLTKAASPKKKRKPQSAAQRKANKLQGQYLGNIRLLSAAAKAKVKAVRVKDGVEAAIRMAQGMKKAA